MPEKAGRARRVDNNSIAECTSNDISCISEPDESTIGCSSIAEPKECADFGTYRSTNIGTDHSEPNGPTIKSAADSKSNFFTYSCASFAESFQRTNILPSGNVDKNIRTNQRRKMPYRIFRPVSNT